MLLAKVAKIKICKLCLTRGGDGPTGSRDKGRRRRELSLSTYCVLGASSTLSNLIFTAIP